MEFLNPNYFNWRDTTGNWQRSRAVTLSVDMRSGEKIGDFGEEIDVLWENLKKRLPEDLIFARTSDQPLQVAENVELFMSSLWEAIILVVIVALVGFWEWRSALLMALSIPLTLAMTFARTLRRPSPTLFASRWGNLQKLRRSSKR